VGDETLPERRVAEALLRHLQGIFADLEGVVQTSLFPANRQESLVTEFDTAYYPDSIGTVRLELRVYTNGDFHITYFETYLGERRHCRWDRHDQDHNSRDHFHPLPSASTAKAVDKSFPTDVTMVLRQDVLLWIDERLGELWDADSA
jgi:hypothetical protein